MDPRRAPQRVRRAHLVDERPNGRRGAGPAKMTVRRPVGPSPSEPLPMPTDHRLGLHDDQGRTPVPPGVSEEQPKQSISRTEWRTPDRALEHRQLFDGGLGSPARPRGVRSRSVRRNGARRECRRHERSCAPIDQRINQSLTIRFWRMTGGSNSVRAVHCTPVEIHASMGGRKNEARRADSQS